MLQTLTHNYYSIIDPPNVEELLDAVENANLMDEQEFTWTDGCLIEVERLNLNDNFFNLIRPSVESTSSPPRPLGLRASRAC